MVKINPGEIHLGPEASKIRELNERIAREKLDKAMKPLLEELDEIDKTRTGTPSTEGQNPASKNIELWDFKGLST